MRTNAHKENLIFERLKKNNVVLTSSVSPKNVLSDIDKIHNNQESVYIFESGDKANFLYNRFCVNDLSFNYLQLYNDSVYLCFIEIKKMLKEMIKKKSISDKTKFYISSEYESEFLQDFWYDVGGSSIQSFAGYWILETNEKPSISINRTLFDAPTGSIIMFGSGSQIELSGIKKAISFNISTINKIVGQYPQKWMPI